MKIIIYHDVTLSAGEGGTVSESGGRLAEGTTLSVTATPAEGHHFVQWSDGVTDNPRSLVVGKEDVMNKSKGARRPLDLLSGSQIPETI